MNVSKFEELEVYQLSERLSDKILKIVDEWEFLPKKTVGIQLINSSDSIGANLAEGYGRESLADRSRFAKISRGSLFETKHWIVKAFKRKLISDVDFEELQEVLDILLPKLSAYKLSK